MLGCLTTAVAWQAFDVADLKVMQIVQLPKIVRVWRLRFQVHIGMSVWVDTGRVTIPSYVPRRCPKIEARGIRRSQIGTQGEYPERCSSMEPNVIGG